MIDVDLLRRDLAQLVSIASTGGTDGEVLIQRWCAATLTGLGLEVDLWPLDLEALRADPQYTGEEVDRAEAWGCVGTSGPGTPALILNGHVDVVPSGDPQSWTGGDPWSLREDDGYWYGRGVADMKGGVAAIIAAARAVAETSLRSPFAVHTVIGEEDGGIGTLGTLRRGHRGQACIIAEPTAHAIVAANAGSLTFRLEVHGIATHGSMRASGVSAIDVFESIHAALRALESERNLDPPAPFTTMPWPISVGMLTAGDWASTVPDLLVAHGRYGVRPGESLADAMAAFEAAVASADHQLLRTTPALVSWPGGRFAAGALRDGDPFLSDVAAAIGGGPRVLGAPYGSDLRLYAAADISTVQFGPGDVRDAHAVDERVLIDDVVACAEAYVRLIRQRCG